MFRNKYLNPDDAYIEPSVREQLVIDCENWKQVITLLHAEHERFAMLEAYLHRASGKRLTLPEVTCRVDAQIHTVVEFDLSTVGNSIVLGREDGAFDVVSQAQLPATRTICQRMYVASLFIGSQIIDWFVNCGALPIARAQVLREELIESSELAFLR